MTTKELAATGIPPSLENAPPGTSSPVAGGVHESVSLEDGEVRSGHDYDDSEDISNVEVNLSKLVASKMTAYPQLSFSADPKLQPNLSKNMKRLGFSLLATGVPLLTKRLLLLKQTKLVFSETSSRVVSDFLVMLSVSPFLRSFL
jgi:hypothetical protein